MQIVIDKERLVTMFVVALCAVADNDYQIAKDCVNEILENIGYKTLPKGHGRLIDVDVKKKELADEYHGMISDESMKIYKIIQMLDGAPTIIEADKEGEECQD